MLILDVPEWEKITELHAKVIEVCNMLSDICPATTTCIVSLVDEDITMCGGGEVRGKYMLRATSTAPVDNIGWILINRNYKFNQIVTVLVHEYAHHLTLEDHEGKMYNLFKDWLREELMRRWQDVKRRED